MQVRPEPETGRIEGEVMYIFEKGPGPDTLWLDAVDMEFEPVRLNNTVVPYGYNGRRMVLEAPHEGGRHTLWLRYRAHPSQTVYFVGWDDRVAGNEQIWTQGQGRYTSHWVPSFDDMREKLVFDLEVQFRPGFSVIANGTLSKASRADSLVRWHYNMEQPMSSYLLAFAVGRFDSIAQQASSGVPLYLYFPPEAASKAPFTYKYNRELFDFVEAEIGLPYPWQNYKQAPLRDFMYAGMENTGTTFFDESFLVDSLGYNDRNYVNVNAHELAHQWFGNLVTEADGGHHWLHEGFATYYAYLAEEAVFGRSYLDWKLLQTVRGLESLHEKGEGAALLDPEAGSLIFYEKGALALFALREKLGDRVFRKGVLEYLRAFSFRNATVDDFIQVMEQAGGNSLQGFRQRWLENTGFPTDDALGLLRGRSPLLAGFLDLRAQAMAPDSLPEAVILNAWEASDDPGYRAALLREYYPSFGDELLKKAYACGDMPVLKAALAGLEETRPWMLPFLERLLDAPSYELREAALFRLWTAQPESRAAYLDQTAANGSLAGDAFRQLWWVLALFTDSYASLERRAGFLEDLRETTAASFPREVRQNGFSLLRQIDALGDQNLRDLIGATEHHSWQFRLYARRLLDELMQKRPGRTFWESLAGGFPEASFPYFYDKLQNQ